MSQERAEVVSLNIERMRWTELQDFGQCLAETVAEAAVDVGSEEMDAAFFAYALLGWARMMQEAMEEKGVGE